MELPLDISLKIDQLFPAPDRHQARDLVFDAKLHDGSPASARCQRCAVFASGGSLVKLAYYVDLLKIDFRDVIVAGEYESSNGKLVRVRDLNKLFVEAAPNHFRPIA